MRFDASGACGSPSTRSSEPNWCASTRPSETTASPPSGSNRSRRRLARLFAGGFIHPGDGALDPAAWVRRLAAHAAARGCRNRRALPAHTRGARRARGRRGRRRGRRDDRRSASRAPPVGRTDAWPGARHRAARRDRRRSASLRPGRLRLLAAAPERPADPRRSPRYESRDRADRRRSDHALDPGASSSRLRPLLVGRAPRYHAPLGRDLGRDTRSDPARRARPRLRPAVGRGRLLRATATCSASPAASSSRASILGERLPELDLFSPARFTADRSDDPGRGAVD